MKKWSVVIPTIWRSEYTLDLLEKYQNCEWVSEIILINNAPHLTPEGFVEHSKLIHHRVENIYVNPAWNLGVSMSSNENILISNDDVSFDVDGAFKYVSELEDWQVLGVHKQSYNSNPPAWKVGNGHFLGWGWGCLLFVRKSEWIDIPEDIKVWFGDNWLSMKMSSVGSITFRGGIETKMSTSAGSEDIKPVIQKDIENWERVKNSDMKAVIVLGMHRSATSMTARALHQSEEVYMGNNLLLGLPDNPKGHYEQRPIILLNDRILSDAGGSWHNPPSREKILNQFSKYREEIKRCVDEVKIHARENGMKSYGFKDPRLCLTIELFLPFLDNPQFVMCFRDDEEIARSLEKRNGMLIDDGKRLTHEYNQRAVQFISNFYKI